MSPEHQVTKPSGRLAWKRASKTSRRPDKGKSRPSSRKIWFFALSSAIFRGCNTSVSMRKMRKNLKQSPCIPVHVRRKLQVYTRKNLWVGKYPFICMQDTPLFCWESDRSFADQSALEEAVQHTSQWSKPCPILGYNVYLSGRTVLQCIDLSHHRVSLPPLLAWAPKACVNEEVTRWDFLLGKWALWRHQIFKSVHAFSLLFSSFFLSRRIIACQLVSRENWSHSTSTKDDVGWRHAWNTSSFVAAERKASCNESFRLPGDVVSTGHWMGMVFPTFEGSDRETSIRWHRTLSCQKTHSCSAQHKQVEGQFSADWMKLVTRHCTSSILHFCIVKISKKKKKCKPVQRHFGQ